MRVFILRPNQQPFPAVLDRPSPLRYHGEQIAKGLGYRPAQPFTSVELVDIRRNFAMLSIPSLQTAYSEALERCKLGRGGRPPNAEHIQVLVQACGS